MPPPDHRPDGGLVSLSSDQRINIILQNIRNKSIKNNIDPKITNRIWKNMISAYIDYEKRNFKKKK